MAQTAGEIAFSRPAITVLGSGNHQHIKKQAALYLDHLDIQENIQVTIILSKNLPKTLHGITRSYPLKLADADQVIRVWVDANLNREYQSLVLAHEMIHVKQFAKKELVAHEDRMIWKGTTFYNFGDYDRHTPWEKEAYSTDQKLARLVPRAADKNNMLEASSKLTVNTPASDDKDYVKIELDTNTKNLIACSKTSCDL
ncbi:hypothetical protein GCM10023188_43830 [Pontibacter saemangeumensis]|uniref:DUF4157 domain-containing protein n=2 Tax=Pontibacter saemangeumensis TaxID=1084525 RepID=A0ABP8M2E0_9BACT